MIYRLFKFLFLLIFIILLSSCHHLKNLNPYYGLNGKPTTWKQTKLKLLEVGDSIIETPKSTIVVNFDEKGRIIQMQNFRSNGSPYSGPSIYKYDKFGNVYSITHHEIDGSLASKRISKRNKYGVLLESYTITKDGNKHLERKYIFDKKSRTQKAYTIRGDTINVHTMIKYDKNWNKIEKIYFDSLGTITARIIDQYDIYGNNIRTDWSSYKNKFERVYLRKFNERNEFLSAIEIMKRGNDSKETIKRTKYLYKRDDKGNWIKRTFYVNDDPTFADSSQYDYPR